MRYPGQSHELPIALSGAGGVLLDEAAAVEAFHRAHERAYGFREAGSAVEVMNMRLAVTGQLDPVTLPRVAAGAAAPAPAEIRRVHLESGFDAPVFARAALGAGARVAGPAIVEQPDTTTLVLPGWEVAVDDHGSMILRRSPS
jgi:N-methylhydantoinase A